MDERKREKKSLKFPTPKIAMQIPTEIERYGGGGVEDEEAGRKQRVSRDGAGRCYAEPVRVKEPRYFLFGDGGRNLTGR